MMTTKQLARSVDHRQIGVGVVAGCSPLVPRARIAPLHRIMPVDRQRRLFP
jgi:hypothetical protein